MIEQGILDKYIDESSFNMNDASRQKPDWLSRNFLNTNLMWPTPT